jgi:hypothetical protein
MICNSKYWGAADCGEWLGLCGRKVFVAYLAPLKRLCRRAGHFGSRLLSGGMVGLVGVTPYQPDSRQTENILLMNETAGSMSGAGEISISDSRRH